MNKGKTEQTLIASDNLEVVRRYLNEQLDRKQITKEEFDIELQDTISKYNKRLVEILSRNE